MECIGIETEHILLRGCIPTIKSSRKEIFIFLSITRIIFLLPSKGVFILYITYECPPCVKTRKHLTSITQRNIHWTHSNKCGVILVFDNGEYIHIRSEVLAGYPPELSMWGRSYYWSVWFQPYQRLIRSSIVSQYGRVPCPFLHHATLWASKTCVILYLVLDSQSLFGTKQASSYFWQGLGLNWG